MAFHARAEWSEPPAPRRESTRFVGPNVDGRSIRRRTAIRRSLPHRTMRAKQTALALAVVAMAAVTAVVAGGAVAADAGTGPESNESTEYERGDVLRVTVDSVENLTDVEDGSTVEFDVEFGDDVDAGDGEDGDSDGDENEGDEVEPITDLEIETHADPVEVASIDLRDDGDDETAGDDE